MPIYGFDITGRIPSKKNSKRILRVRGRTIVACSKDYAAWQKENVGQLRADWGNPPIQKAKSVSLAFQAGDRRAFDLTNKAESVMDLMVDAGVLIDDDYDAVPEVRLVFGGYAKGEWRCSVIVTY